MFVRGLDPEPGAWTELEGARLKVFRLRRADAALSPGEVRSDRGLVVGTGDGAAELVEVQPAGKRRMAGADLARGLHLPPGARCG